MPTNWRSGSFLFPTSTGLFSVTGLPWAPQGMFFIGTNSAVEDSVVSTSAPNLFFGMVWHDYLTGLPDSQSVCLVMGGGINVKPHPIVCAASTLGCTEDYRAELFSINSDGFTLNVTDAAPGDRPISWMAFGGFEFAAGSANLAQGVFYDIGAKILTAFAFNYRTTGGIRDGCENGLYTSLYLGAAAFPTVDNPPTYSTRSWGSGGCSHFTTTGGQGFTRTDWNINPSQQFASAINIDTGDFPPVVFEDRIHLWREDDDTIGTGGAGGPLRWFSQWWQAENWNNQVTLQQAIGNITTWNSGNVFLNDIEAAMYVGILGAEAEGGAARARLGIGFITEDYQGCVAANDTGHLFQSRQYGICSNCDAFGAVAAEGTIAGHQIFWETLKNDGNQPGFGEGGLFAWGPAQGGWVPQIYRRWPH